MTVKINVKQELGIAKSFEVKESNKNIRATWELQKMMAKLAIDQNTTTGENPEDFEVLIDTMLDVQNKTIDYIVNTLKLTDAQADKVEELEFQETIELATRISSEVLHVETAEATEADTGLEG